jgi:hypothetical protein
MGVPVRFFLPVILPAVLALAGCSTPEKRLAQAQHKASEENSRRAEEMRMRAVTNGEAGSQRGAEVIQYDPEKTFDPSRSGVGTVRPYLATKGAKTKEFQSREARVETFRTRDFASSKSAAAQKKYATDDANTRGKYVIPNTGKEASTKTAATKEAWDAQKKAPARELADARRPYLGPESKKLGTAIEPKELANWRNGEGVVYTDGVVEKISTFKQLSIDDVRELLNKNK